MKPYSATHNRHDYISCDYGCCTQPKSRGYKCKTRAKRTARAEGRQEIEEQINDSLDES